jgi:Flagellar biosynthesis pathway, component FliR
MLPADLERALLIFGLGGARTVPFVWLIPAFGGPHLPARVRLALGLGLSALCFPLVAGRVPSGGPVLWVLLLLREGGVGLVMGFVAACMFRASEAAGWLTDVLRGANLAEAIAPEQGSRSSPLGDLLLLLAVVIFLEMGGAGILATALARSYEAVPLGAPSPGPATLHAAALLVVAASAKLIEAAIGLAAPALVALLLADLALGALGRAVPQIPLYFVGMPAKALLGVGAMLAGLATLDLTLSVGFRGFLGLLERAAQLGR